MFVIGLTGSIAMGKTTTARLFAEEGVPVHDADAAVHKLYEGEAAAPIEAAFPGSTEHGKVDRAALGQRVAGNAGGTEATRSRSCIRWCAGRNHSSRGARQRRQGRGARYSAAVRDRRRSRVDAVVVVSAPAEMQRARALERGIEPGTAGGAAGAADAGCGKAPARRFRRGYSQGIEPPAPRCGDPGGSC